MDWTAAFQRASEGFENRVRQVAPDQWTLPTPCTEWNVRALVNHVAGEYLWVPEMMAGRTVAEVGDRFDGDVLGDSPADVVISGRAAAVAAAGQPGALESTVHLSFGDMPGSAYLSQMVIDSVLHSWDLARAIGADETLDPEAVGLAYAELTKSADQWRAGGALGPATTPADESTQAKLIALAGR